MKHVFIISYPFSHHHGDPWKIALNEISSHIGDTPLLHGSPWLWEDTGIEHGGYSKCNRLTKNSSLGAFRAVWSCCPAIHETMICQMLHGTNGIFTYMKGWLLWFSCRQNVQKTWSTGDSKWSIEKIRTQQLVLLTVGTKTYMQVVLNP